MRVHLPLLCENSTAKTAPVGPTMSETWETLVPEAAPRYSTLPPGLMWMLSTPAKTDAASFDLKGFHTLYSVFSPSAASTLILFSLYTLHADCVDQICRAAEVSDTLHCLKSQNGSSSALLMNPGLQGNLVPVMCTCTPYSLKHCAAAMPVIHMLCLAVCIVALQACMCI